MFCSSELLACQQHCSCIRLTLCSTVVPSNSTCFYPHIVLCTVLLWCTCRHHGAFDCINKQNTATACDDTQADIAAVGCCYHTTGQISLGIAIVQIMAHHGTTWGMQLHLAYLLCQEQHLQDPPWGLLRHLRPHLQTGHLRQQACIPCPIGKQTLSAAYVAMCIIMAVCTPQPSSTQQGSNTPLPLECFACLSIDV